MRDVVWKTKNILVLISGALLLQILVSLFIRPYYLSGYERIVWYAPIIASVLFCVGSFIISLRLNKITERPFCGTLVSMLIALPFLIMVLVMQHTTAKYGRVIATVLSHSFLHLGGFRAPIVWLLGSQVLYNPFYSIIMTTVVHITGFLLADVIHFTKRIRSHA